MEDRTALGTSDGNDGRGRDDAVSDPTKQTENAVYADVGSPKQRQRPNGEAGASAPNDSDVRPPDAAGGVPNAAGNNDTNTNANTNTIKAKEVTPLTGGQRTRVQHSNSDLRLCLTARKRLEESGTLRGIKRRLGEALDSCGWKDELRSLCRSTSLILPPILKQFTHGRSRLALQKKSKKF